MLNPFSNIYIFAVPLLPILSGFAVFITIFNYIPYILGIKSNKVKPHYFSWIIWGLTTFIVFLATLAGGGGYGSISIGISGIITFYVAYLAFRHRSDLTILKSDRVFLLIALASIPAWYVSNDPFWATAILTSIDIIGFFPTIQKAILKPFEEDIFFYFVFVARNLVVIASLDSFNWTTLLFPVVVSIACLILILLIIFFRLKFKE